MSFPFIALVPLGIGATVIASGLLAGLIHLLIVLIVLAIVYYLLAWVLGALGAPAMITKLVMILCAVIALYFIVIFLLSLAP